MKKIIALALCLMLALCAVSAVAEENTAEKTHLGTLEVGEAFRIQGKVPDNYTFNLITSNELNMGLVMNGLRLMVVGAGKGPHMGEILELLGKEETLKRIDAGVKALG